MSHSWLGAELRFEPSSLSSAPATQPAPWVNRASSEGLPTLEQWEWWTLFHLCAFSLLFQISEPGEEGR